MRPISDAFRDAINRGHKAATKITCTIPGGETMEIGASSRLANGARGPGWTSATVSASNSTGVRYQANLSIVPAQGFDTYGMVATPGAIFRIKQGVDYGAGNVELIDFGVYEAASGGVRITGGDISLALVDQWQAVEQARFIGPHSPPSGTRAALIGQAILGAVPGTPFVVTAEGGIYEGDTNVWDRDRTRFVQDMAKDGSLDVYFDAAGAFTIRPQPIVDPTSPVWTFRTGVASNINTAERERPFDRSYNVVVISPLDDTQSWDQIIIVLDDPDHPRHPDKLGRLVPFFYSSPTLETAEQATEAGRTIMQRILGNTETISINGLGNPALEVGDAVAVVHERTDTDPGFQAVHLIDSFQMDLYTGTMTLATRSSALAELQET